MAVKKMLIDAAHPEETRVAVVDGNRLEEIDVESAARKQLKGNIYLAKVTRVEPSLQAAFVDYGGNRHGFLAFSEIHPDYYQIPVEDREKLIAETKEADGGDDDAETAEPEAEGNNGKPVETLGGDEMDEEEERRATRFVRRYKIQEVIKPRQIILVQVVKEERGNKGAALTTYLSLAGRYCVLMPNTARGGGISRRINSGQDRKRLKTIINSFDIPDGIAVIVRTAGADRSKAELKRDYSYLERLWNDIRERTLESTAPDLIHEEANIINRAIRDIYSRDIEEILVEGDEAYRGAKDLMKLLIPSHAKKVQPYKDDTVSLFNRFHVENELSGMNRQEVQLKSGGYIVINPTEALVAIDVNSGRSTRGRSIEETATKTNQEAAEEIARQLRLRDLAGLVVIDFIDMEYSRNQHAVERRLKEHMRVDRARIQIGRISPFGLLELSRQRLRPSITETVTDPCPHCGGSGIRQSIESTALHVLRAIEEEGAKKRALEIEVLVPSEVALYILNQKRQSLMDIEARFEIKVLLAEDNSLIPPDHKLRRIKGNGTSDEADDEEVGNEDGNRKRRRRPRRRKRGDEAADNDVEATSSDDNTDASDDVAETTQDTEARTSNGDSEDEDEPRSNSRRRRGRRGGRRRGRQNGDAATPESNETGEVATDGGTSEASEAVAGEADGSGETTEDAPKPARRRRRRRSRTPVEGAGTSADGESNDNAQESAQDNTQDSGTGSEDATVSAPDETAAPEPVIETAPKADPEPEPVAEVSEPIVEEPQEPAAPPEPIAAAAEAEPAAVEPPPAPEPGVVVSGEEAEPEKPARRGWWKRGG